MSFAQIPYIEIHTPFFYISVLLLVLIGQFLLGVLLPGQSHRPPWVWWFAQNLTEALRQKLDRPNRTKNALRVRGGISLAFILLVAWGIATLSFRISESVPYGWISMLLLVWGSVNIMTVWRLLRGITAIEDLKTLPRNKKTDALSDLTGLVLKTSDPHTVARAALLYTCRALSLFVVGTVMAFALFGPVGLMFYVFIMSTGREMDFGKRPRSAFFLPLYMFQVVVDFIPARITALLIYVAAIITPTARPGQSLQVVFDGSQRFPGLNFSVPIKAFAGATGASLGGGLNYQSGDQVVYPWIGHETATAKASLAEVKRGFVLHIYATVFVILALLIGLT